MLDDLLELFERDKKSPTQSRSGLRGRLSTLLGDSEQDRDRDVRPSSDRDDDAQRRSDRNRSRNHDRDHVDFGD